jgi:hypothetical protein
MNCKLYILGTYKLAAGAPLDRFCHDNSSMRLENIVTNKNETDWKAFAYLNKNQTNPPPKSMNQEEQKNVGAYDDSSLNE